MKLNNRGNWSLIGMLMAAAIIGVVIYLYMGQGTGPSTVKSSSNLVDQSSKKKTVYGKAMDTGKAVDCQQRLRQIRTAIEMSKTTSEANPPTLKDAGLNVRPDYFKCPVSNQDYTYDPATGIVKCPNPGHANF